MMRSANLNLGKTYESCTFELEEVMSSSRMLILNYSP